MITKPTLNFRETIAYEPTDGGDDSGSNGKDMGRRVRALESAVKEMAQRVQSWLETYAPATARSPFVYVKAIASGNLSDADCMVYDVYAPAALSLTMPAHKANRIVVVKDGGGNAATFNITLKRAGSRGTINGVAGDYVVSNNGGFAWFISDGDNKNWRRIISG